MWGATGGMGQHPMQGGCGFGSFVCPGASHALEGALTWKEPSSGLSQLWAQGKRGEVETCRGGTAS
jgi:hypothetical protein